MDVKREIIDAFEFVLRLCDVTPALELHDSTILLETGLDSLGFAILVSRLEDRLGYDPFTLNASPYYPTTFKEFVDFYQINRVSRGAAPTR